MDEIEKICEDLSITIDEDTDTESVTIKQQTLFYIVLSNSDLLYLKPPPVSIPGKVIIYCVRHAEVHPLPLTTITNSKILPVLGTEQH